jgi:ketosteroid isomerase-like protein
MSQENVELAREAVDAFNRRDLDAFLALANDEVETVSRLVAMEGGYHGRDGARRWWENLLDAYPDLTAEVVQVRDFGDLTVTMQRSRGHGAGSDVPVDEMIWVVSQWRNKKCVWWSPQYTTEADALEAVRLRG